MCWNSPSHTFLSLLSSLFFIFIFLLLNFPFTFTYVLLTFNFVSNWTLAFHVLFIKLYFFNFYLTLLCFIIITIKLFFVFSKLYFIIAKFFCVVNGGQITEFGRYLLYVNIWFAFVSVFLLISFLLVKVL